MAVFVGLRTDTPNFKCTAALRVPAMNFSGKSPSFDAFKACASASSGDDGAPFVDGLCDSHSNVAFAAPVGDTVGAAPVNEN